MPTPLDPFKKRLALVLALALLVRASVLMAVLPDPERVVLASDARQYLGLAATLLNHGFFGTVTLDGVRSPESLRTPGYPIFLALLMPLWGTRPLAAIAVVQAILGAWIAPATAILGRQLFNDRVGVLAGVLYAVAPISAIITAFAYAETLFTAWLIGGTLLLAIGLERDRRLLSLLAGLAYAVATLTRPIAQLTMPLLVLVPLLRQPLRRTWIHALVLAAGFALPVAGWMGRNAYHFGRFGLTTVSDLNLYYYNAASLEAHRLGISLEEARVMLNARLAQMPPSEGQWAGANEGELARAIIFEHPLAFVWYNGVDALNGLRPGFSFLLKLFDDAGGVQDPIGVFMRGDIAETLRVMRSQAVLIVALEIAMLLHVVGLIGLSLGGLVVLLIRRRWSEIVLLGLLPALLLYLPGIASNARFRAPTEPFLAILAAVALSVIVSLLLARQARDHPNP